jgi:multicomponent Na+:H+ antiporter subunit B
MKVRYDSVIIDLVVRVLVPFIQVFAIYVAAHAHYGPGGGFQGGAILAASVLLVRLCLGHEYAAALYPLRSMLVLGGVGLAVYGVIGFLPMLVGGEFLDYSLIPIEGLDRVSSRYWGTMVVELGLTLGVFGILVSIFDDLMGREE